MSAVKHQPASPLPVLALTDEGQFGTEEWRPADVPPLTGVGMTQRLTLEEKREAVRRANAYPKLVKALLGEYAVPFEQWAQERFEAGLVYTHQVYEFEMRHALLLELGEREEA